MFHVTTNKTEESWSRADIKKVKPSEDPNDIVNRINRQAAEGMDYKTAIDFLKAQLGTWRRFYKQSDVVELEEDWTETNLPFTKITSLNIYYTVTDLGNNKIKIKQGFEEVKKEESESK